MSHKTIIGTVIGALLLAAAGVWLIVGGPGPNAPGGAEVGGPKAPPPEGRAPSRALQLPPQLNDLRSQALDQQAKQEWRQAAESWERLHTELVSRDEFAGYREEAARNLEIVRQRIGPSENRVEEQKIEFSPPSEVVPEDDLVAYYPVGRKVRSLLLLNVTGRGVDQQSLLKGESAFAYQYRVVGETTVLENNGRRLVFKQSFPEVIQVKANSESTLELSLPQSPVLGYLGTVLEAVLRRDPRYLLVQTAWKAFRSFDPNLTDALTGGKELLERLGWRIDDSAELELVELVEQLSGREFEIEYISDLGVTHIKVTRGEPMERRELDRLAHSGSLLLDYYIFPGARRKPGQTWTVRADEVSGMVAFGVDATARGELKLKREEDETDHQGRPVAKLRLVGGDVDFQSPFDPAVHEARIRPEEGELWFSLEDQILREARLHWQATTFWRGKKHLLSSLTRTRHVQIQSYYEAERIDARPITGASRETR